MPRVSMSIVSTAAAVLLLFSLASSQSGQSGVPAAAAPSIREKPEATEPISPQLQPQRSASTLIFARSDTVYMKSATIRSWLQRQPEFDRLGLAFAADQGHADYYVEVTRPVFTWDWTYCVVKTKTGKVTASGKVTAATAERAAKALAPKIIQALYSEAATQPMAARSDSSGHDTGGIRPKRFVAYEEMARTFESAKTISVRSLTVWFAEWDLADALKRRPEFSGWGYTLLSPCGKELDSPVDYVNCGQIAAAPDLLIEVNRPLFTWDWTFSIQEWKTKRSLATGKLTAISGEAAAPKLAQAIVNVIANARGLPVPMQRQFDRALAEVKVRTWNVRHVSGQSHLETGKGVQLAIGEKTIFARDGENILFSVPVEDLLQFSYSSNLRDRSVKWFEGWDKAGNVMFSGVGDDPNATMGALMVMLPMLAVEYGVGGLLKGSAATDHFLVLNWKDATGVSTVTLQGGEKEVREICAELDKFGKRRAVDLDAATQKLRAEFETQVQSTNYVIETDQPVAVDNNVLPPGKYRVILLQRENNTAEVYFLQGPENAIAAVTMAQYKRRTGPDRANKVSYRTVSGLQTFEEIQVEEHVLRFSPVPVFPEEV